MKNPIPSAFMSAMSKIKHDVEDIMSQTNKPRMTALEGGTVYHARKLTFADYH